MTLKSSQLPRLCALGLVLGCCNAALFAAPTRFVQINSARGEVSKLTATARGWQPAKVGDKLIAIDKLRTGAKSTAVLRLDGADSSLIYVGPNTLMQVTLLTAGESGARDSKFYVKQGRVSSKVRTFKNRDSRLQIQTPACMGGVRGTELAVTTSQEGMTAFGVTEGAVAVSAQGQEVALPAGTMNRTKPGEPPTPPEPLPTSLEITLEEPDRDFSTNQPEVTLRGRTAPGAILTLNDEDLVVRDDGTFRVTVTLREGENTFTIAGTDVAANTAQVVRKITLDTTAPPLELD